MDFLRRRSRGPISYATHGTRFAASLSLLGISLGPRDLRRWRSGPDNQYLDPAPRPLFARPALDPCRPSVLQNVGAPRKNVCRLVGRVILSPAIHEHESTRSVIWHVHTWMENFRECFDSSRQPRPGPRRIAVGLERIHAAI